MVNGVVEGVDEAQKQVDSQRVPLERDGRTNYDAGRGKSDTI